MDKKWPCFTKSNPKGHIKNLKRICYSEKEKMGSFGSKRSDEVKVPHGAETSFEVETSFEQLDDTNSVWHPGDPGRRVPLNETIVHYAIVEVCGSHYYHEAHIYLHGVPSPMCIRVERAMRSQIQKKFLAEWDKRKAEWEQKKAQQEPEGGTEVKHPNSVIEGEEGAPSAPSAPGAPGGPEGA